MPHEEKIECSNARFLFFFFFFFLSFFSLYFSVSDKEKRKALRERGNEHLHGERPQKRRRTDDGGDEYDDCDDEYEDQTPALNVPKNGEEVARQIETWRREREAWELRGKEEREERERREWERREREREREKRERGVTERRKRKKRGS